MGQVIEINQRRLFTLEDAREALPLIRRITRGASEEVERLSAELALTPRPQRRQELEQGLQRAFFRWQSKVHKLGGHAKGMWLVDFDSGHGYYCWVYPEPNIEFFHGYDEGFRGRVKIH